MSAKGTTQNHFGITAVGYVDFMSPADILRTTGDLNVGGALAITGGVELDGAVTLGDAAADVISVLGTMTIQEPLTIDKDSTEALLVRDDADDHDVFAVDTVNDIVNILAGQLRLSNSLWLSGRNNADDANVNMFRVNTSDQIDVGAALNVGTLTFPEDAGAVTAMDMPVSATPADGVEESYTFKIDGSNVLKIYGEADSAGGVTDLNVQAVRYSSDITVITASADNVDVSGCSVLNCDTNGGHITIGGFIGGKDGQMLHIFNSDTNNVILEDDEGTGNQDIKSNTAADITITAEGGATLVYDGTDGFWRVVGVAL